MFTRISTEVIDAESGHAGYHGYNEQLFDVKTANGEMYTFATNIKIGLMSKMADIFAKCEGPEDIEQEIREIFRTGDYTIDVVICERPMQD